MTDKRAMAEMNCRVKRYFLGKRFVVCEMYLLVLKDGDADDEFVLAQLAEFLNGLALAFIVGNHVDHGIFLVFHFVQIGDIRSVSHATYHHAFHMA